MGYCSDAVCDKLFSLQAALAAKRARELVRTKSVLKSSSLPGKLADCASTDPEESGEPTLILAVCVTLWRGLGSLVHVLPLIFTDFSSKCRNLHR